MSENEVFISVDVETAGPIPGEYSLLSIGACLVDEPSKIFQCELKPITSNADKKALEVANLSLDVLARTGLEPNEAMARFAEWVNGFRDQTHSVVFVGFNAPFDWSFINYYFHRFLGSNPFGFSALDIKAYYMGLTGCEWTETRSSSIHERLKPKLEGTHDALQDALYQAELFRRIRGMRI